jgi:hypothetical protein
MSLLFLSLVLLLVVALKKAGSLRGKLGSFLLPRRLFPTRSYLNL